MHLKADPKDSAMSSGGKMILMSGSQLHWKELVTLLWQKWIKMIVIFWWVQFSWTTKAQQSSTLSCKTRNLKYYVQCKKGDAFLWQMF